MEQLTFCSVSLFADDLLFADSLEGYCEAIRAVGTS